MLINYLIPILLFTIFILTAGVFVAVRRLRKGQLLRLKKRGLGRAVATSLFKDQQPESRERARDSINATFSVIRVAVFLIGLLLLLVVGSITVPTGNSALISIMTAGVTLILGLAAKPVIENIIAGFVLTLSGELRIGDTVLIDDHYGTIEDISIVNTTIKLWDWRRYIIPNTKMMTKEAISHTLNDAYHWATIKFWVAPDADLKKVETLAIKAAKSCDDFLDIEEPRFWIIKIEKDAVECWVATWAKEPSQAWRIQHQTRISLLTALREHKIPTQKFVVKN